jgi:hypothetical protein
MLLQKSAREWLHDPANLAVKPFHKKSGNAKALLTD